MGSEKPGFMRLIYSPEDIETQRKVREVFDPAGIANPGKVLPERETAGAKAEGAAE